MKIASRQRRCQKTRFTELRAFPNQRASESHKTLGCCSAATRTFATFRRRVWVEAGGYPVVLDLEDLLFWLKAAKLGWRITNPPEVMGEHFSAIGPAATIVEVRALIEPSLLVEIEVDAVRDP